MPKFKPNAPRRSARPQPETLKPVQIDETIQFTSSMAIQDAAPSHLTDSLMTVLENMEALGLISPEQLLVDEQDDLDLKAFEARLRKIFGPHIGAPPEKQIGYYLKYLKKTIVDPCHLTGAEEFEWEEKYLFGPGRKSQYEKLKQNNPSHTDIFLLLRFLDRIDDEDGILVEVKREGDGKGFTLPLIELEVTDPDSPNCELLEDYSLWFLNYCLN
jgi:hypothetical protein